MDQKITEFELSAKIIKYQLHSSTREAKERVDKHFDELEKRFDKNIDELSSKLSTSRDELPVQKQTAVDELMKKCKEDVDMTDVEEIAALLKELPKDNPYGITEKVRFTNAVYTQTDFSSVVDICGTLIEGKIDSSVAL